MNETITDYEWWNNYNLLRRAATENNSIDYNVVQEEHNLVILDIGGK